VPTRFRFLALLTVVAASAVLWPTAARAQDKPYALRFSSKAGDPKPRASMPLRANQLQDFYIYVENLQKQKATLKVEIRADNKVIDGGVGTAEMDPTQTYSQAIFGKPAAPPEKAPPPAPPAPPQPPLAPLQGALKVVLLDAQNMPILERPLTVANPQDYVEVTKISFDPKATPAYKNRLRIELKAKADTFAGPRCRVDMVLDTVRILGLVDNKLAGNRGGSLGAAGAELILTADNLEFKDSKEIVGPVYLTIDGWERAYTFKTSFAREGTDVSLPEIVTSPVLHLLAPSEWNPAQPLPVTIQADNLADQVIELGFDRDADTKFSRANGEIVNFAGNRRVTLLFNPTYPGGALQLKPEVKDWGTELEVAETFGSRNLRVRLMKNEAEALKPNGDTEDFIEEVNKEPKPNIQKTVLLDASPPTGVKFVKEKMPNQLVRGDSLPVSATCADPKSVKQVVFFVGKLGPDGKTVPPNAVPVPGELTDKEKGIWTAELDAPTDKKGKFDVTVQFVKVTGTVATDTIKIELVDPGPGKGGGKASIEGKITDVAGAPQGPGVPVELRDDKGNIKDTTKTDDKSNYIFKDVMPGTYQVTSARTGTRTKGATTVQVKEAEKKTDVDVKLSR
jgi:hypothetical protein